MALRPGLISHSNLRLLRTYLWLTFHADLPAWEFKIFWYTAAAKAKFSGWLTKTSADSFEGFQEKVLMFIIIRFKTNWHPSQ